MRVRKFVITAIAAAGLLGGVATAVAPAVAGGTAAAAPHSFYRG